MHKLILASALLASLSSPAAMALSLAPEEFAASRQLACVLAEQSLGYLTETEYGTRTHDLLDDFEESERDIILSKALGYVDGLTFALDQTGEETANRRLEDYVRSSSCQPEGYRKVTLSL